MERSAQKSATRERLLVAAAGCFAKKGYASCTVADIARAAGLAQGAMYVHFQSKEELFIEMIAREHAQGAQKARQALDTTEHLAGILAIMESCVRDVGYPVDHGLWTEILAVAARDERVRASFRQSDRLMREVFARLLVSAAEAGEIDPGLDFEAVSCWLYALVDGLIARTAIDPDFDLKRHSALFRRLVRQALQPVRE